MVKDINVSRGYMIGILYSNRYEYDIGDVPHVPMVITAD